MLLRPSLDYSYPLGLLKTDATPYTLPVYCLPILFPPHTLPQAILQRSNH